MPRECSCLEGENAQHMAGIVISAVEESDTRPPDSAVGPAEIYPLPIDVPHPLGRFSDLRLYERDSAEASSTSCWTTSRMPRHFRTWHSTTCGYASDLLREDPIDVTTLVSLLASAAVEMKQYAREVERESRAEEFIGISAH